VQEQGRQLIDLNAYCRNIALRLGHFASRSFAVTHSVWKKVLESRRDILSVDKTSQVDKPSMEILTDYVVCNSSLEPIRFGQVSIVAF
jgi:hypothetical protein